MTESPMKFNVKIDGLGADPSKDSESLSEKDQNSSSGEVVELPEIGESGLEEEVKPSLSGLRFKLSGGDSPVIETELEDSNSNDSFFDDFFSDDEEFEEYDSVDEYGDSFESLDGEYLEVEGGEFNPFIDDDEDGLDGEVGSVGYVEEEFSIPVEPVLGVRDESNNQVREAVEDAFYASRSGVVDEVVVDELDSQVGMDRKVTYEVSVDGDGRELAVAKRIDVVEDVVEGGEKTVVRIESEDGRRKWVARKDTGRLSEANLKLLSNLNRASNREDSDELARGLFSRVDKSSMSKKEREKHERLMNRAIFGVAADARGSKVRFTEKDREVLRFLGMFKYANAKHLARIHQVKLDTMLKRLYALSERGLVNKVELYGALPLWFLTEGGSIASGLELPRVKESGITYSMLPHQFVVNHVAGNLWGGGVNVLGLEDFPERYRRLESGEFTFGESLVSEYQVQSSFASAKSANHKADVWRPAIIDVMNREFKAWKNAGGVGSGVSPEFLLGNEFMWTLFPPFALKLAYHVPDLVLMRPRNEDGTPNSIAVEVELANKPLASYERTLNAYKYDSLIYSKVIWVVKSRGAARKIQEAARKIGTWAEGRVGIVPIYTEEGVFKGRAVWTI